ncbi:MAG: MarC family protein [Dehalococcoidia bacterium]
MNSWVESLLLTFVPLFIVVDALGNLPFVMSFSEGMSKRDRRKMIHVAVATAVIVGLAFLFFGQFIKISTGYPPACWREESGSP